MSLNLLYWVDGYPIDFPFQTPTDLTLKVMNEKNNAKRLSLIESHLMESGWDRDRIHSTLNSIKTVLKNPKAELTYI
jgi:hypothetical protein